MRCTLSHSLQVSAGKRGLLVQTNCFNPIWHNPPGQAVLSSESWDLVCFDSRMKTSHGLSPQLWMDRRCLDAVGDNLCGSQLTPALPWDSLRARRQLGLTCLSLQVGALGLPAGSLHVGFHGLVPSCEHSSLHPAHRRGWGMLPASRFTDTHLPSFPVCVQPRIPDSQQFKQS